MHALHALIVLLRREHLTEKKSNNRFNLIMWSLIVVAMAVAIIFCVKKQGYHYDENYSYYSTNVTYGLHVYDREWKPVSEMEKASVQVWQGAIISML